MGWASGSYFAEDLYRDIRNLIPKENRRCVANSIIAAFEQHDADDWSWGSELGKDAGRKLCGCDDQRECECGDA